MSDDLYLNTVCTADMKAVISDFMGVAHNLNKHKTLR